MSRVVRDVYGYARPVIRSERLGCEAALYGRSALRIARARRWSLGVDQRLVFVVGSPRSGTTFTGRALGSLAGFVDLGEVEPWATAIPGLFGRPDDAVAQRVRHTLEWVRRLALARGLRGVEQTPETSFVLSSVLRAYPEAVAVHVIRDGRDVVTSLLERGWLNRNRTAATGRRPSGATPRFWVEPDRKATFREVSDATRAAWAWRRYVTAAGGVRQRTVEVRYEDIVARPERAAAPVAKALGVDVSLVADAFSRAHANSAGRWKRDLSAEQLADVEREVGSVLVALGYPLTGA